MCSKHKSNAINDTTSDLMATRCVSDIVFAAESNQVCRKEGEKKVGQGQPFRKPPSLPFISCPHGTQSLP